ncbi:MAG: inositol monophosphatase [Duodenibacillus sp.]|nr:inositol monophosphatase [Duodenibacillus sp.]
MPSPIIEVATKAALKAGRIISAASNHLDSVQVQDKGRFDYVSQVDRDSEAAVIATIQQFYPKDVIVSEEASPGEAVPASGRCWIIDPLDGTTNFLHGFPQYSVSIAFAVNGVVQAGVVYDPSRNELFAAERGEGATLNQRRIRVSGAQDFARSLIGTGLPFRADHDYAGYMPKLERVCRATSGVRRAGSAALDLCYVAAGRLDAFWESGLHVWDMAAGALIVLEAGGLVTDLDSGEDFLAKGTICTGTPKIFAQLLARVRNAPAA